MVRLSVPILRENESPNEGQRFLRKPKQKISAPALLGLFSKHFEADYFNLPTITDIDGITFQDPVTDPVTENMSSHSESLSDYDSSSDSEDE